MPSAYLMHLSLEATGNFYPKAILFQQHQPAPLMAASYYVGMYDYYKQIHVFSKVDLAFSRPFIFFDRHYPSIPMQNTVLSTACVNLSLLEKQHQRSIDDTDLILEFNALSNGTLSTCFRHDSLLKYARSEEEVLARLASSKPVTDSDGLFYFRPEMNRPNEKLLLCEPRRHIGSFKKNARQGTCSDLKATFFAYLWQKELVTEKQLYQESDVMLGDRGEKIRQEKRRLEKIICAYA